MTVEEAIATAAFVLIGIAVIAFFTLLPEPKAPRWTMGPGARYTLAPPTGRPTPPTVFREEVNVIPTIVVIPSRYQRRSLTALVDQCLRNKCVLRVLVYDNGYEPAFFHADERVTIIDARGWSLYRMWNAGWDVARSMPKECNVSILNDDVALLDGALDFMSFVLRGSGSKTGLVCPNPNRALGDGRGPSVVVQTGPSTQWQRGTGMPGFCFMIKAELPIQPVDERFYWWYGDDDLIRKVYAAGYRGLRLEGEPVHHVGGRSARRRPELAQRKIEDKELFRRVWGDE